MKSRLIDFEGLDCRPPGVVGVSSNRIVVIDSLPFLIVRSIELKVNLFEKISIFICGFHNSKIEVYRFYRTSLIAPIVYRLL